jgi:hypothetical protein
MPPDSSNIRHEMIISQASMTFKDHAIHPKQKPSCTNIRTATVLHVLGPATVP